MSKTRACVLPIAAVGLVLLAAPTSASPIELPPCLTTADATSFEAYGPTDVNAQAGNGRLTVNENEKGTITVYKYPNPSLYNQVKYMGVERDAQGRVRPAQPNEGSFAGIRYSVLGLPRFAWLRDWQSEQRNLSNDLPVPVTTYRSPDWIGLTVTATDLVTPAPADALIRNFEVVRRPGSPVTGARLVYYENFNPIASHLPLAPVLDWCFPDLSDQRASYDGASHSIVHTWEGIDLATVRQTSVAHAFGWNDADNQHQVGNDAYAGFHPFGPADGYRQASSFPYWLGGSDAAEGQVTSALSKQLTFTGDRADARLTIASGESRAGAIDTLQASRGQAFSDQLDAVRADWRSWLARTRLPDSADPRVVEVAKRGLITTRLASDTRTGAIVASVNTQGPYGEDWIRDGAYINEVLDMNGHGDAVTRHNLFYRRVQTSLTNPSLLRAPGNWPMNSYTDGIDGGPIPYEIDETGYGIWTLVRHYGYLGRLGGMEYLRRVYPAIVRAADYLTACEDRSSGFQCIAWEDDRIIPSQTLVGAETVYLGLRSALAAARAMNDRSRRVELWRARLLRLGAAIESLYDPVNRAYRDSPTAPDASTVSYSSGGTFLWPVAFRPYADERMQGEAVKVKESMDRSLAGPQGSYEAKALLGLAYAWSPLDADERRELNRILGDMAAELTTDTGMFGEAWKRLDSGEPLAGQDQPHVWAHALFYLAAVKINGSQPYRFGDDRSLQGQEAK